MSGRAFGELEGRERKRMKEWVHIHVHYIIDVEC